MQVDKGVELLVDWSCHFSLQEEKGVELNRWVLISFSMQAEKGVESDPSRQGTVVPSNQTGLGRVTYEHNGECFFLPYSLDDVLDNSPNPQPKDQVTFFIATDKK